MNTETEQPQSSSASCGAQLSAAFRQITEFGDYMKPAWVTFFLLLVLFNSVITFGVGRIILPLAYILFWTLLSQAGWVFSAIFSVNPTRHLVFVRISQAIAFSATACGLFFLAMAVFVSRTAQAIEIAQLNFHSPFLSSACLMVLTLASGFLTTLFSAVPDIARARDAMESSTGITDKSTVRFLAVRFYRVLSFGWRGSIRQWDVYEKTVPLLSLLTAALSIGAGWCVLGYFSSSPVWGWNNFFAPFHLISLSFLTAFAVGMVFLVWSGNQCIAAKNIFFNKASNLFLWLSGISGIALLLYLASAKLDGLTVAISPLYAFFVVFVCVILPQIFWIPKCRQSATAFSIVSGSITLIASFACFQFVGCIVGDQLSFPSSWNCNERNGWFVLGCNRDLIFFAVLAFLITVFPAFGVKNARRQEQTDARCPLSENGRWTEFESENEWLAALVEARKNGLIRWSAYAPNPVPGMFEAAGLEKRARIVLPAVIGGIMALIAFAGISIYALWGNSNSCETALSWTSSLPLWAGIFATGAAVMATAFSLAAILLFGIRQPRQTPQKLSFFLRRTDPQFESLNPNFALGNAKFGLK